MGEEYAQVDAAADPGFSSFEPEGPHHFLERAVLKGHNREVTSLTVAQDHSLLVSGSRDCTALVWTVKRQQELWAEQLTRFEGHNHFVSDIALSGDLSHLITSSWDKTIRMWELKSRSLRRSFPASEKDVLALSWSPDNRRIVSAGRDRKIRIWTVRGEMKYTIDAYEWGTSISCSPSDQDGDLTFAVGFWDGGVRVWRLSATGVTLLWNNEKAHSGRVTSVMFTPDGQFLFSGGSDRAVNMWSIQTGERRMGFKTRQPVNAVATSPTNAWVCAASYDGITVWDVQQGQIDVVQPVWATAATTTGDKPKRAAGRHPECSSLCWAEDGSVLYAGYNNGEIRVWEVRSV